MNVLYALSATVGAGVGWHASGHEFVRDLHSHIHLVGVLTCEHDICWGLHLLPVCILFISFVWDIVTHTSFRQLRMGKTRHSYRHL
jgi:hypothetical protein